VRDVDAEHRAILDAAVDRDIGLASKLLQDHYRSTGDFLADLID
jgi:DNA-binding GntR family transcriptional regulator